ncbi:MAG TPA: T9SS type A sorting domain-containing protein [Ignavibacteria bacterium]|nr:T9SS type A sorting domain-containing protein [Ignavibacteria bacterium]HQY53393.1 T9SS type A sorting domain-containing protein [Ignavibacteria bacterium]HRA99833.1 T9SS type A sorting domain-containing protein [Ignavibacteria bacterium]
MKSNYKVFPMSVLFILMLFIANSNLKSTTHTVTVESNMFTPPNLNVSVGDTIKWQWLNGSHTTTCNGVFPGTSLPIGAAAWDSPMNSGNTVFMYPVTVAGNYVYKCQPHAPDMGGTITASSGSGSILLTENFDYPVGDSLGAHGWVSFSGGSTNFLSVTSPGLVYSGYRLSNIGNATTLTTSGQDAYTDFSSVDSTGDLYVSFMINLTSAQATAGYFEAFLPPTSTTLYTARFYAKDVAGQYQFGLSKSTEGAGGIFYTTDSYNYGTTYLVVIKYKRNPGTADDEMFAYVFNSGVPSTEPSTPNIGPVTGTATDGPIGRVALRQGTAASAPELRIDGIQASKSWSDFATSITNYENIVSDSYELYQNYPNPFNPSTTIKFNIAEKGFVNLTIFNALGQEIQTLVNDSKASGLYTVDFNGSNLNSGIYFYQLTFSGNNGNTYSETKKLLLIK